MTKTDIVNYRGERCNLVPARYNDNGNLALQVMGEDGIPYCIASVNPGVALPDEVIAVKDYSENKGMVDFLKGEGILGELYTIIPSGWVDIPVYYLTESGKELFKGV